MIPAINTFHRLDEPKRARNCKAAGQLVTRFSHESRSGSHPVAASPATISRIPATTDNDPCAALSQPSLICICCAANAAVTPRNTYVTARPRLKHSCLIRLSNGLRLPQPIAMANAPHMPTQCPDPSRPLRKTSGSSIMTPPRLSSGSLGQFRSGSWTSISLQAILGETARTNL